MKSELNRKSELGYLPSALKAGKYQSLSSHGRLAGHWAQFMYRAAKCSCASY